MVEGNDSAKSSASQLAALRRREGSGISWTDFTFNPWVGCRKISPGCANCYAEKWAKRGKKPVDWGEYEPRRMVAESTWDKPRRWDRAAAAAGVRLRVFCASMADVMDDAAPEGARDRLWDLIRETEHLDWLLLTKRPENFEKYLPDPLPRNIWLGVTAENQKTANKRVPLLMDVDAAVRWVSVEPMIGPVDLTKVGFCYDRFWDCGGHPEPDYPSVAVIAQWINALTAEPVCVDETPDGGVLGDSRKGECDTGLCWDPERRIHWVVCGGETGSYARPMAPQWARDLRDQCRATGTPFWYKQSGAWMSCEHDAFWDYDEKTLNAGLVSVHPSDKFVLFSEFSDLVSVPFVLSCYDNRPRVCGGVVFQPWERVDRAKRGYDLLDGLAYRGLPVVSAAGAR